MKKTFKIFAVSALILAALCIGCLAVSAATVYVADNGTGDGKTADTPVANLTAAFNALGSEGGEVVLVKDVTIRSETKIPAQRADVKITSKNDAAIVMYANLVFNSSTYGKTITVDNINIKNARPAEAFIFCGYNNFEFGDGVVTSASSSYYPTICIGDYSAGTSTARSKNATTVSYASDCDFYIGSGKWERLVGGNYRPDAYAAIGTMSGNLHIEIAGGEFVGNGAKTAVEGSHNLAFDTTTFTGMNYMTGDLSVEISGGTFNSPIYAVSRIGAYYGLTAIGDYHMVGDIEIDIIGGSFNGGEIGALQISSSSAGLLRGNYTLNISSSAEFAGGTILSAECVEAYDGQSEKSTLVNKASGSFDIRAFDVVNGKKESGEEPIRIAFVGDSITWGTGSSNNNKDSYPAQLQNLIDAAGKNYIVGDFGVGASGVMATATYLYDDTLLYHTSMEEFEPQIVFFALGTNDASVGGGTQGRADKFYADYKKMISNYASLDSVEQVYISTAIYRHSGYGSTGTAASRASNIRAISYIVPFQKQIASELAVENHDAKFTLVDLYALMLDKCLGGNIMTDLLHLSSAGYKYMAQTVYDAMFNGVCGTDKEFTDSFYLDEIYVKTGAPFTGSGTAADPMGNIDVALGRISRDGGKIIILNDYTVNANFDTPIDITGTLYLGGLDGTSPKFSFNGDSFKSGSALVLDNMVFSSATGASTPFIIAKFNDLTFGRNFATERKTNCSYPLVIAGYNVYTDGTKYPTTAALDTTEGVSSDKDATVTFLGGNFNYYLGGNRRSTTNAPIGSYSGNLLTVIDGVTFDKDISAAGMNYNSGVCTMIVRNMTTAGKVNAVSRIGSTTTFNQLDNANNAKARAIVIVTDSDATYAVNAVETVSEQTQSANCLYFSDAPSVTASGFNRASLLYGAKSLYLLLSAYK